MESGRLIAGRYRLRERLGHGGMSVVWRADDDVLGRQVALKVLSAALAGDPELRRQIRAEARAAAGLRHANVVAVFDYGEFTDAGRTLSYVVMELVEGRSLADMLTAAELPWRLAVLIGAQVGAALAAAHSAGIVHRDVKPANVMVTTTGVKLVDFGISAPVGELDGRDGQLLGTPAYLAPERLKGAPVRPATDVYALGLLLYRALSGRMPWNAPTVTQMLKAHVYASPAPMPAVPGLPGEVSRLVTRCLAKNPGERPSATEVAEVLGEIAGLPPSTLLRTASEPTVALSWTGVRRDRRTVAVAGVAVALLTVGGTWWALADPAVSPPAAACTTATCPATTPSSASSSASAPPVTARQPGPGTGAVSAPIPVGVPPAGLPAVIRDAATAPAMTPSVPGPAAPKTAKPKKPKPVKSKKK
ncbi:serine/threonine-protein kinase [Actinoplanes awajinensis]|uniref:non-specific serine/threonine protein kinase n=1 Tax=Actinoplanes awajinensis subsp. mycoplanecinus TaxID=135947 RepID=A0A101JNE3_9ACTN|nr:serine/threonine-protein kinase [Actinoplanes awajinensis]KUL29733.1 serine/threonine protein kinase [Actinoplanes awajinensis subsp. mycoplanecinus]